MPQSSPVAWRRACLLRQHGGALTVTGLCEGKRERRLDERRLRRSRLGRRERAFADLDRRLEVELLRREVAQERLSSSRSAAGASSDAEASASSTKRRPSETRSASVKYQASVPNRPAMPASGASCAYVSAAQRLSCSSSRRPTQARHSGPRSAPCAGVRQRGEVLRVRFPGSREAAAFGKALERIVPHRVEQVVACVGARERDRDDRLVDERAEQLDHRHLVEPVLGARGHERGERRTASMNRNVVEQGLLVRMQEVVAPLDEGPERGPARIGGRPIVEELQAPPDEREELREPEHVDPRGGELDREREAVDETADLGGEPGVLVRQLEARARRARTRGEELHGRSGDRIARIGVR